MPVKSALKKRLKRSRAGPSLQRLRHRYDDVLLRLSNSQHRRHALSGARGHHDAWKAKRDFQIGFLKTMGLHPAHSLLEIGCGTLRGGLPIIDFLGEGQFCGIDVRPVVLDEARKELAEAGLEHKKPLLVLTSDLSTVDLRRDYDYVWAFSVLPHLEDDILRGAFFCARRHLKRDGIFFATAQVGPAEQVGIWRDFPDLKRPFEFYQQEATLQGMTVENLGRLSRLGHPESVVNAHHHMLLLRPT